MGLRLNRECQAASPEGHSSIEDFSKSKGQDDNPRTLRGFVWHLRNAVAHFRFEPRPERGEVKALYFHDQSGFKATVKLDELRDLVEKLAKKLKEM